jgi:L-lactate dehydrogenase (cytochrome)
MIKDKGWMATLLQRAQTQGCKVLFLTCDLQTPGARYRDVCSGMARNLSAAESLMRLVEGMRKTPWVYDVWLKGRPHAFGNLDGVLPKTASFAHAWQWISQNFDPSVTWRDLDFIRQHWQGPIVIKGVMTTEDAKMAASEGADGIVVSNHGGRQLDGAPSSISVLPDIANAVAGELRVLIDSGVRSGLDVLKARQRGADACMIGRPWAFALSACGQLGVERLLEIFAAELRTAQVLSGVKALSQ